MRTSPEDSSQSPRFGGSSTVNVLLLGTGGREHALALKLRQSPRLGTLHVQPDANAGLLSLGTPVDVPVSIREIYRLIQYCDKHTIGLVVIGPEQPLADGFADRLASPTRHVFGPSAAGARLEADKAYAKELMRAAAVPTAEARAFTDADAAIAAIEASCLADDRFLQLRDLQTRVERAPMLRRSIDALRRIGDAALARTTYAAADMTLLKDILSSSKGHGRASNPLPSEQNLKELAVSIARLYSLDLPSLPVIKACGLAAGKGVVVPRTLAEAAEAIDQIMRRRIFGDAGAAVLVEEKLKGREVSVLAITDGRSILVLPPCQDHKRLLDEDDGPNTGGMGAYCPSDALDDAMMSRVERDVLVPILDVMRREGIEYKGVLYAGLMLTHAGPKVLEFNCRFGDPECQPLMARLESDLLEIMLATCEGRLADADVRWTDLHACSVVIASPGYPAKPRVGAAITGIEDASGIDGVSVLHAATKRESDGTLITTGGRVLTVTALGASLEDARRRAYDGCARIRFDGMHYRRDIGSQPLVAARSQS
ncbi:MAG: phosphoribosylamine--glycine ligase [Phycisphaeraceae bacterium]|nr:phosphoribosylamine--glycine ligase [Phycisphaeraceae bacterium]